MSEFAVGKIEQLAMTGGNQYPSVTSGVTNGIASWKPDGTCRKCNERPATEMWSEGALAAMHGAYAFWCKVCVLTAQLEHARERAAAIPELEQQLAELRGKATP